MLEPIYIGNNSKERYTSHAKAWDTVLIRTLFDPAAAHAILKIPIPQSEVPDKIIWTKTTNGIFTTKSLYRSLADLHGSTSMIQSYSSTTFPWSKFWQCKQISPRVLYFIWRVLNNAIAVRHNNNKFIPALIAECPLCHMHTETVDHLFVRCSFTQALWFASPLGLILDKEDSCSTLLSSWLSTPDGYTAFHMAACLMWSLWKARNNLVFNNVQPNFQIILKYAASIFNDFSDQSSSLVDHSTELPNPSADAKWMRPPPLVVKINVDASFKFPQAACAAIARDSAGKFISCSTQFLKASTPIEAEANAFLLGINLARNLHLPNCIIEGDSLSVVNVLNNSTNPAPWRIRAIISDIRNMRLIISVSFVFTSRKANSVAHNLAKHAFMFKISDWWMTPSPPSCIADAILSDRSTSLFHE
ncbi:Reverse transcriptase zinc-binding domain [Macleaya cordata]|uniref:Reverse transcriptase zinc-binding domain n=1 Tax=Macleaya cordata TaxID=56857 RepID=A0A200QZU7_MACCD|nr:Reverse transcriptase zinc-binding domain [Macleaya cordata]